MRSLTVAAAFTASALLLAACGGAGGPAAPPAQDVPSAILASMTAPQRIAIGFDVALDLEELRELAADFPEFGEDDPVADDASVDQAMAMFNAFSLEMAAGSDQSTSSAVMFQGTPLVEFRQDPGELAGVRAFDQLLAAPPADVTVAMRIDEAVIREAAELFDAPVPSGSFSDMLEVALATDAFGIPEQLADLARALARGDWAGIGGRLDLASLFAALGLDEVTLEEMAPANAEMPTTEDLVRLVTDSVTFTRDEGAVGEATYHGDLDADAFVRGGAEVLGRSDTTGMLTSMMAKGLADMALPRLDDVVVVTFSGNLLTSMTINGAAIMAEAALSEHDVTGDRADEFRSRVRSLTGTKLNLVVTFRDHDDVGNQLEGLNPVTIEWDDLTGLAAQFAPLLMLRPMGPMGAMGALIDDEAHTSSDDEALRSVLRNLAIEQEDWFVDHATYTDDIDDLQVDVPDGVFVVIARADEASYCMEVYSDAGAVLSFDSLLGEIAQGTCS